MTDASSQKCTDEKKHFNFSSAAKLPETSPIIEIYWKFFWSELPETLSFTKKAQSILLHRCGKNNVSFFHHTREITLSPESGYLWIPLGTNKAILAAAAFLMVSTNTRLESSSFFLQLFGQPSTIVFGFMPPKPAVWILVG